jgi:deoxyribodipyrimidine photolyase-related protein
MNLALVLGNQLHHDHPALNDPSVDIIVMIEAQNLCQKIPYHKHKIIFLLSSMRHYANDVKRYGKKIIYHSVETTPHFLKALKNTCQEEKITKLSYMLPPDTGIQKTLEKFCFDNSMEQHIYPSQLFLTPLQDLTSWFSSHPTSTMESFYRWQRKRTGMLMDDATPIGEKWNYDHENRKPLPKNHGPIPRISFHENDSITQNVINTVNALFLKHPGLSENFWLPTTREHALEWLDDFVSNRLALFGTYEDAMDANEVFLYHSVLSPLLNCGLLSAQECAEAAIHAYEINTAPLHSVEGFIRQIIGWREYMYGMYLQMGQFKSMNYFKLHKELETWWYSTDAPEHDSLPFPVRRALERAHSYGYNHHIERLMILGNWFLLNGYSPLSVYRWFSAMYVDAYEWVMVPNVIGMSQYADGGRVATKPYISGGNYLKKMGRWGNRYDKDLQQFTDLYWMFLTKHYSKLKTNIRMSLVLKRIAPK